MNTKVKDTLAKGFASLHNALYKKTGGKYGGSFRKAPVLLITTTGRKSGKAHTNPLLYLEDDGRIAVVASYGGDDRSPAWFLNLQANPEVTVNLRGETKKMRGEVASPEEKASLWPKFVAMYGDYAKYQTKTSRDIPVVILTATP